MVAKLKEVRLCLDCDTVFTMDYAECPSCASSAWCYLTDFVPAMNPEERGLPVWVKYQILEEARAGGQ